MTEKRAEAERSSPDLVHLGVGHPIWDRFFQVSPLIVVGTKEPDATFDLAPKHMAMALGWENYFGFMCTPRHGTYANAVREGCFTVSFPRPSQVLVASLAAAPRCEGDAKPSLTLVETMPATRVDGVLIRDGYLYLECETDRVVDGFGENSLIAGRVVEALVSEDAIRRSDKDDEEGIFDAPLLAYVSPGRYAAIAKTFAFPFHVGWSR